MTGERWQEVKAILESALQLDSAKRSAYLDEACSSDPSLRGEVESLLAADEKAQSSFLNVRPLAKTLEPGTRLGGYEIESLLGAGGMGEVYRARDLRLRREVAIKVLPAIVSADPERLRRFEQEATAAAALSHPNILAVHQLGSHQGTSYLVSELLEGETLREQLRRKRVAFRRAIDYAIQITRGLVAAHEKGIVHRDLKPENLFITKDEQVKILDFGLAKLRQPQPGLEHSAPTMGSETEPGTVMGTVGYMSPEQVRGQPADHRADIFAFGAILYEMLTGQRAFQRPTSPETMVAILKEDPPGISQFTPGLPPALQRIVQRCLEKIPEQRFHSASDLVFALEALPDSGAAHTLADAREGRKTRPLLAFVVVLLVALIVAGGIYWQSQRSKGTAIHSVAVLPFANASKDPEMDYLGEGISEEITNSLSRLPNLQVMAQTIVAHYKLRQDDPQKVGHDLHVDAVLIGRVDEHAQELDVESELVDVATGAQLWGQRYTRNIKDVSLLQPAMIRDLANLLRPQLGGSQRERLAKIGTQNAEAYQLYLKGRYHLGRYTEESFRTAAELLEKAVAFDSNYSAAYAGLADVYAAQAYFGFAPSRDAYIKSRDAAGRALELDSEIPEPYISLAISDMMFFHKLTDAQTALDKAMGLDPNSAFGHVVSCWLANERGKSAEAISECRKAVDLDPLSIMYNYILADTYLLAREYNEALQQANRVLEIDPRSSDGIKMIGYVNEMRGNYKAAMEQWVKNAQVLGHPERAEEFQRIFEKTGYAGYLRKDAEIYEAEQDFYDAGVDRALLNEKDASFADLEKAVEEGQGVDDMKLDPELDNIRSDPRFDDLLRRIGVPQ